ncbi:MAG: hypothetical protein U0353_27725 [Sandaracinus sp.]
MQPGMMQPGMMQPGMQQPGMMQPGMMQPGMQQPGMQQPGMAMGQMQIASGTRVYAQWHGDQQMHPATIMGFENGMYRVDWQEQHLGANGYVYPQQIQVATGAPGMAPGMAQGMPAKAVAHDPYGKDAKAAYAQPDMHAKGGMDYGKQPDMHAKGGMDYGKQPDMHAKGGMDMHGKGMPQQAAPAKGGGLAIGAHVTAQHANGSWYPGRVVAMQNGMIGVDWDDAKLGQSSWVQPHQIRH